MSDAWNEYTLADGTEIRPLPKVSLHDHLDGGLRAQTIIELADGVNLDLPEAGTLWPAIEARHHALFSPQAAPTT